MSGITDSSGISLSGTRAASYACRPAHNGYIQFTYPEHRTGYAVADDQFNRNSPAWKPKTAETELVSAV